MPKDITENTLYCHAINIGSVGKPLGGYALLRINETSSVFDKDSVTVEIVRFDYDRKSG